MFDYFGVVGFRGLGLALGVSLVFGSTRFESLESCESAGFGCLGFRLL